MRRDWNMALSSRLWMLGLLGILGIMLGLTAAQAAPPKSHAGVYGQWANGPSRDPNYFPIAVWLQSPANASKYKAIGVNLYVGLWQGPTEEQLRVLKQNGMSVICDQNEYVLKHLDEKTIVGWMQQDEPDNAQANTTVPVLPKKVIEHYKAMKGKDPSRPVFLNLGMGVAWDSWWGRGDRTKHPEDYPEYVKACDIASYDIYPADFNEPDKPDTRPWFRRAEVGGKLWYVAHGVDRLCDWANNKPVWNAIECTQINNPDSNKKATPQQVKAEVWMSIVHGSRGIVYFCHQFQPNVNEAGLLADAEMTQAVGKINRQILELAAVINSPSVPNAAKVTVDPASVEPDMAKLLPNAKGIAMMTKKHEGATYLFTVRMQSSPAKGVFQVAGASNGKVNVLGEDRTITMKNGRFEDDFEADAVHIYRIRGKAAK